MRKSLIYCFLVLGFAYGCEEIISVPDISEETVEVLAPSDGAVLENTEVVFSWSELEFAEQYQVQVAQPNFVEASQIVLDTIVGDSLSTVRSFSKSLESNSFKWRIRGLNSSYMTDYVTQSFTVDATDEEMESTNISESTVSLIAPSEGIILEDVNLSFSWDDVQDATSYRLQVAFPDFENPIQIVVDETLDTTTSEPIALDDDTAYQWRVKAMNDTSETGYSVGAFSVNTDEALSEQSITIVSPEDGFETTETSVVLSWELLDLATLYRVVITDTADDLVYLEQTTTEAAITVEFEVGTYTWAVRAESDTENTTYTEQTINIIE